MVCSTRCQHPRFAVWRAISQVGLLLLVFCQALPAEERKVYFGLMHGHTSYSDGSGTPEDAFKMAKEAGLDFIAVTEHNHKDAAGKDGIFLTPPLYKKLKDAARTHTVDGKFLAIYGQEVSTISAGNHVNVFWADEIVDIKNGDFKQLYEKWLPDHSEVPFIQFNHPDYRKDQKATAKPKEQNNDYGIDDYGGDFEELVKASGRYVGLIELIIGPAFSTETNKPHQNGVHQPDYLFYLNKGYRLAPSAGQDNHEKTWGVATEARMGVWAEELTESGIKKAIADRNCYASEDENVVVKFSANGQLMGSAIPLGSSAGVNLVVEVSDPDEKTTKHKIQIFYDDAIGGDEAQVVEDVVLEPTESEASFTHVPQPGGYYFAKITQAGDKDDIWTAPIWIGSDAAPEFAAATNAGTNTDDPERSEIDWSEAVNYVGKEVTISGRVIRTFNHQDKAVFFNFDPDYESTLNLVLLKSDFAKFGDLKKLQKRLVNRTIRVKGKVTVYGAVERLQIRLEDVDQLLEPDGGE